MGFSAVFEDLDNDGFPELFVTNDAGQNYLYQNRKDGTFQELALLAGVAYNREGRARGQHGRGSGRHRKRRVHRLVRDDVL